MEKYDGMNRVEAVLAPSPVITRTVKKRRNFKPLIIKTAVVAVLAAALLCCKFLPIPHYQNFIEGVKKVVCFDLFDFISSYIQFGK